MSDPLLDLVARLPQATMAPDRARRSQARCHRVLVRRAKTAATRERPLPWQAWSRALVGLVVVYLTEAVRQALRVYGAR
jgi:hypothetical protein